MQTFTSIEVGWIIQELNRASEDYLNRAVLFNGVVGAMSRLRGEQLESISARLETALAEDDKRIAIK